MRALSKKQKVAILISILLLLLCVVLSHTYRPYIYRNHIHDFHLADTIGSWLCIPCASCFFWGITKHKSFPKIILIALIAFVISEFIGLTFDYFDLLALGLSSLVTYISYLVVKRFITK
jgi:hypothetical protein